MEILMIGNKMNRTYIYNLRYIIKHLFPNFRQYVPMM